MFKDITEINCIKRIVRKGQGFGEVGGLVVAIVVSGNRFAERHRIGQTIGKQVDAVQLGAERFTKFGLKHE